MNLILNTCCFLIICTLIRGRMNLPIHKKSTNLTLESKNLSLPNHDFLNFMTKYGYLRTNPSSRIAPALFSENSIANAIKEVQKYGALKQTGQLDEATLNLMKSPRCGVPDIIRRRSRYKRYSIGSVGWKRRNITYYISNWSAKIGKNATVHYINEALKIWAPHGDLQFQRIYNHTADITLVFGRGYHGDHYPFDGPGQLLAHAYYPHQGYPINGDIHFDASETWITNQETVPDGIFFFAVAIHEVGHSLGLGHSSAYNSVMFPYYTGARFSLDQDDVLAMDELFKVDTETARNDKSGKQNEITTQKPNEPEVITYTYEGDYETVEAHKSRLITINNKPYLKKTPFEDICTGFFDTITLLRNNLYVFKKKYVLKVSLSHEVLSGYPIKFETLFNNQLPLEVDRIDAAYERNTDYAILIFHGNQYYVYNINNEIDGPFSINDFGISTDIEKIDAVFVWAKNSKTYLFSGNSFWRFNETTRQLDSDYPKDLKKWGRIPNNMDTAISLPNGKTYFFKHNLYWLINNYWLNIEHGYPKRNASAAWINSCNIN